MSSLKITVDFIHATKYSQVLKELQGIYNGARYVPDYWMQGVHICDTVDFR